MLIADIEAGQHWQHKKTGRHVRIRYVGFSAVDVVDTGNLRLSTMGQASLRAAYALVPEDEH